MRTTVKDHKPPPEAARTLRMRIEQQLTAYARFTEAPAANLHASLPAEPTLQLLADLCDLFDRVTILEKTLRSLFDRLAFLANVSRMLGCEDWNDLGLDDRTPQERGDQERTPEPGALVTAAQASAAGASGPASSSSPGELAGNRRTQ